MRPNPNKKLNSKIVIDFSAKIGQGSTGNVYKGISISPQPHPVAIKAIPLR